MIVEPLHWHTPAEKLPDDETTVLLRHSDADAASCGEPVWFGYRVGSDWYSTEAFNLEPPKLWAHVPTGEAGT